MSYLKNLRNYSCILDFLLFLNFLIGCSSIPSDDQFASLTDSSIDDISKLPVSEDSTDLNQRQLLEAGGNLYQAATLSPEEVEKQAKAAVSYLDSQSQLAQENDQDSQRLKRIVSELKIQGPTVFSIRVYLKDEVNAFSLADGSIRFYSGLLKVMSDQELKGILGHEIGHIKLGHAKTQLQRAYAANAAIKAGLVASDSAAGSASVALAGALAKAILQAQFSQAEEKDADIYSLDFLNKNNLPATVLISALKKLSLKGADYTILSSHPAPEERIKAIYNLIGSDPKLDSQKFTEDQSSSVALDSNNSLAADLASEKVMPPKEVATKIQSDSPDRPTIYKQITRLNPKIRSGWYLISKSFESKLSARLQAADIDEQFFKKTIVPIKYKKSLVYYLVVGPFYEEAVAQQIQAEFNTNNKIAAEFEIIYLKGQKTPADSTPAQG